MRVRGNIRWAAGAAAITVALAVWGLRSYSPATSDATMRGPRIDIAEVLSGEGDGFARVMGPRLLHFPRDHGAHPSYRSEWWYFTGNLATATGRRFGFQLTFFRFALGPREAERASKWAANQVYMAHLALSDESGGRFRFAQRLARGALDLAGAVAAPFRVWLHGWQAASEGQALFPLRLRAAETDWGVDLRLAPGKPRVLQGERGFSQKSDKPGNASYYYSYTRLPVSGTVELGEAVHSVEGSAWLDREWSTSALADDQVGWDWFALQLSDGHDLMFYKLRRRDGSAHPFSAGTLVGVDGNSVRLGRDDVEIDELDYWVSPRDGARYPARWRFRVPQRGIDLEVTPLIRDQELDVAIRYWEGASTVRGRVAERPVSGVGYVELTGYANSPPSAR